MLSLIKTSLSKKCSLEHDKVQDYRAPLSSMGRKKKIDVPVNGSPAPVQSSEQSEQPRETIEAPVQGQMNGTVNLKAPNVTIPKAIQSKADAGVYFREEARKNWKTFTTQSKISDKGMNLKFVALTIMDGVPIAKLEKDEIEKTNEIWLNMLIVYVVGQNPMLTSLKSYIMAWNLDVEP